MNKESEDLFNSTGEEKSDVILELVEAGWWWNKEGFWVDPLDKREHLFEDAVEIKRSRPEGSGKEVN